MNARLSRTLLRSALAASLACLGLGGIAHADVTVISFGGANQAAQDKAFYQPYTASTGSRVIAGEYNGELARVSAMVQAGNVTWDVVEMESPELVRGCDEGLFEKLDYSRIGKTEDFLPEAVTPCGIGIFVWSTAIAYDADRLKEAPRGWTDFWDVNKIPGKRGLRKGAKYTLEFALLADGVPPEKVYETLATPAGVSRAFAKLDELKPHIVWWEAGAQPPQLLAAGDLVMSSAYNGRIAAARKEGRNLRIVWNGSIYDLDYWAIPVGTRQRDEAYRFIAFASRPEGQRVMAEEIAYGPTHKDAVGGMPAELAADLPTAPANLQGAFATDTEFWVEYGEDLEQRFNAWALR
ncbi:ABC transporter substrate-binding protein [Pseudothauera nasutitermitis]|uniref:ABC transporter substrate-binding protein n=1 Tax=Pseudothauera nasutitermitis TaxID=2565930 RepID=A0A4V3WCG1_9RHOO|nr:ABC transporter substrate-binding protein [Pseudothauera nasutitermitis]THF67004.1 ABC transporter substrate-binding protein [Pseudothauera nasutitermitis]